MIKTSLLLYFLMIGLVNFCLGQEVAPTQNPYFRPTENYLILRNKGAYNRVRFFAGDKITFRRKNEKDRITAEIAQVRKNSIIVWGTEIPISEIEQITVLNKSHFGKVMRATGGFARKGGGLFSLVGAGNYLLTSNHADAEFALKTGLSAFAFGQALLLFKKRKYNITPNRPLQVLQRYVY
ncbi:hypothetical protein [Adhaeribacter aquaticus]|uniref:hypothetical protein n=1 Tax=Adhaeribacter aquaticus TaxID=299567 RepID=UPI0003FFC576|nr:hypothetical protein [Adhaeribacter aquaticus]